MFRVNFDGVSYMVNAVAADVKTNNWPISIGTDEAPKFIRIGKWLPGASPMPFGVAECSAPDNKDFVTAVRMAEAAPTPVAKPVGTARMSNPFEPCLMADGTSVIVVARPLLLPEVQKLAEDAGKNVVEVKMVVDLYDLIERTITGFNDFMSCELTHKSFGYALTDWKYVIIGSIAAGEKVKFGAVVLSVSVDVSECIPKGR